MSFVQKRIAQGPSSFGSDLRELRELRGYSREVLGRFSGIHPALIAAFEDERLEDISDPVYAERHIQTLIRALEGRVDYFLSKYRELLNVRQLAREPERSLRHKLRRRDFFVASRLFVFLGFSVLVLAVGTYVVLQAWDISTPPPLEVHLPVEGQRVTSPHVTVTGVTAISARVLINGRQSFVEPSGTFTSVVDVPVGVSMVRVEARRRYSRTTVIERHLMYIRSKATSTDIIPSVSTSSRSF